MRTKILIFIITFSLHMTGTVSKAQTFFGENSRLVSTYSIIARDSVTGELGVAVQSHWFNVGAIVGWGESGVGVVATQSFVNPSFGLRGLDLLRSGKSPQEALDELIASDEGRDYRQLALIDTKGRTAAYTGKNCIPGAGHIADTNFSVQANLMLNDKVWPAMHKAFLGSEGPLAERLITALEAAQTAGGDIRGMQSASIMIFRGNSTGKPWEDKLVDLRVEDNPSPVEELKRLLKVQRAYEHMNNGDLAVEKGDMELAMKEYSAAESMFPENAEMKYWHAVTLSNNGKVGEALPLFNEVFILDGNWKELTGRLPAVGLLNVSEDELKRIIEVK